MDENKTMQNQNPDGAGETTFTQEQVNKIVSDRLAREKVKSEAALAEREQQLAQRELLLMNYGRHSIFRYHRKGVDQLNQILENGS